MKALLLNKPQDFKVTRVPLHKQPDHALLKINSATLCGSDIKIVKGKMKGVRYPLIPGHEWCATVIEAPESFRHLVGERVVPDILQSCTRCTYCLSHKPNLCDSLQKLGVSENGGFAEYVSMRPSHLHLFPPDLLNQEACLIEPLAVAVYAEQRIPVTEEDTVLIIGGGIIGLLIAQVVRLKNPKRIILIDNHNNRLNLARLLAVDDTVNPREQDVETFFEKNKTRPPTIAFEVTGTSSGFYWCLRYIQKAGKVGIVGYSGEHKVTFSTSEILLKLLDIIGILAPTETVPKAIEMIEKKQVTLAGLVSHILPLEQFKDAVNLASEHKDSTLRVCMVP